MTADGSSTVRVLCVDDNELIIEAMTVRLGMEAWIEVVGVLPRADALIETAERARAQIVLLDIDMPGRDPFDVLCALAERQPEIRAIVFSGHVRPDLVDRALECGAWGYVSKTAGADAIVDAIRKVSNGESIFTPDVPTDGVC